MCQSSRRERRGAAVVEFAIVAPIFMLFVFGIIEYGRMVMVQQILTNASREGARVAVLEGSTGTDVVNAVVDYCDASRITVTEDDITILVSGSEADPSTAETGDPVTVQLQVAFRDVSWLPSPMYLGTSNLNASSIMRKESSQ
jgi:Flp pilus assembly protein TadG